MVFLYHSLLLILSCLLQFVLSRTPVTRPTWSRSTILSTNTLKNLPKPDDADFNIKTGKLLSPILIPRIPGSEGSKKVLAHFQQFFATQLPLWKVETHSFTDYTPLGNRKVETPFVNFFATKDPPWKRSGDLGRLVLAAHYDSKKKPEGFIGATDSAVPCALIMHVVRVLDAALTEKWRQIAESGDEDEKDHAQGIMVLFLDGEEAFEFWTNDDSLYGARCVMKSMILCDGVPDIIFAASLASFFLDD